MQSYESMLDALRATGIPFAEYAWENAADMMEDYGVVEPDMEQTLYGDGTPVETCTIGTVDLFLRRPDQTKVDAVQNVLFGSDEIAAEPWTLAYESDRRVLHYQWVFWTC